MQKRKSVVKIEELPKRAQSLNSEKLSEIYGGCAGHYAICSDGSGALDCYICCSDYSCRIENVANRTGHCV
jgi:hypothetical protein